MSDPLAGRRRRRADHDTGTIADPDEEGYFTGRPQRLYGMIPGEKKLVCFTASERAAGHCEPIAWSLAAQRFFDFDDDRLDPAAS
ncbi:hypothetical protein [Nocardia sp. NPDC004123]